MAELLIHLVRHGRVASHRGDVPVTDEGQAEVRAAGLRLREEIRPGEDVRFLCTPTLRSRETAEILHATLQENPIPGVQLHPPRQEWAIRNPDLYLAGRRVEMVSTPEAMATQIADPGVTGDVVDVTEFFRCFFRSPDRIGYWLRHASPPGENSAAVGRRIVAFSRSLLDLPAVPGRRFVCVTHSPVMRAVLTEYLDQDPGEPGWVERIDLTVRPCGSTIVFRHRTAPVRL